MTCENRSLPEEDGRETRPSGVVSRAVAPPRDEGPCRSFEDAHRRYARFLLQVIRRRGIDETDAMDVRQKVLVRLARRFEVPGRVPERLVPVLLGLVDDEVKNHVRSVRRRRIGGEPEADTMPSSKPDPEQLVGGAEDSAEQKRVVEAIFARMTPDAVELIRLARLRELPLEDIAEMRGELPGTVAVKLHRARCWFKELGERMYDLQNGSWRKR